MTSASLITPLILIVLGVLVKYGKWYNLLAGYNTMSDKEKSEIDIMKLATLFKNIMFGMAFIIIIGFFISKKLNIPKIDTYFTFGAFLIGMPYLLIKANYKKK